MRATHHTFMGSITLCLFAGAMAMLIGCEQMYHGGFGLTAANHEVDAKPRPLGDQPSAAVPPPAGAATGPARFTTPADAEESPRTPNHAYTALTHLYGELPGSDPAPPQGGAGNLRQVSFAQEGADFDVDVDPSGKWIVFASTQHSVNANIYRKSIDGRTVAMITNDPSNNVMPAISPDGSTIAFCSDRGGNWDIYVQREGEKAVQVTNDPAHELHPSWSADGKWLVFCSLGATSGQWELVVVNMMNPTLERRFIGFGLFPEFSPSGQKIVYQSARQRGSRLFSIWTVDFVAGEAMNPTEIASATNAAVINPSWSPDGSRLAFATVVNPSLTETAVTPRPDAATLWVVNIDGSGRTRLTADDYVNIQPSWGPDGTIYFVSNRGGHDNIWSLNPGGGEGRPSIKPRDDAAEANVPTNVPVE